MLRFANEGPEHCNGHGTAACSLSQPAAEPPCCFLPPQMVLPSAGARATMRFAQRRAGPGTSNVSAFGQSDVLRVATASAGVNVLIQVRFTVDVGTSCSLWLASAGMTLVELVQSLGELCCASLPGLDCCMDNGSCTKACDVIGRCSYPGCRFLLPGQRDGMKYYSSRDAGGARLVG